MVSTILGALLPMLVTFLLGFFAAWRRDFGPKDASTLNRMVLVYAVPLALFAGTVTTSRAALVQDVPLVITLCAAIISLYGAVFLLCRFVFHFQLGRSALAALTASAPAVPFVGPAVLGDLFGRSSAIPIAISSLVINLTVVPVTLLILALGATVKNNTAATASAAPGREAVRVIRRASALASRVQAQGHGERADRLGAGSGVRRRPVWIAHSQAPHPLDGHARRCVRRRGHVRLRDCAGLRENRNRQNRFVACLAQKYSAARSRPDWFALVRLWQPHRQRGRAHHGHSHHAAGDHVRHAISH